MKLELKIWSLCFYLNWFALSPSLYLAVWTLSWKITRIKMQEIYFNSNTCLDKKTNQKSSCGPTFAPNVFWFTSSVRLPPVMCWSLWMSLDLSSTQWRTCLCFQRCIDGHAVHVYVRLCRRTGENVQIAYWITYIDFKKFCFFLPSLL